MRILITTPVFPPDLGGPAVYVPSLGRYLVDRGHEVRVVAFCEEENPAGYPFPVVAVPRVALPLRYLKSFFRILQHAGSADLVYVNEHLALLAVLAAKLRRKKSAIRVMVDGSWEIAYRYGWTQDYIDEFQGRSYGFKVWLARLLQRWWWRRVDAVVAVSDYLRRIVLGHGIDDRKVHLIHNAYHGPKAFAVSKEEARRGLGIAPDERVIVTVCRLMIWKGVDGIIKALADLPAAARLYVVGDGEELANWQNVAREHGVAERVRFAGNRPHEETLRWIRAADVFVLNSRYEGLSHTLLEVMFLGTPIVCTAVCGNPELVEHERNGLLVPFNDVPALTAAIARLLADEKLARDCAERSREKVKAFDREEAFGRLEALFQRIIAGEAPGR